MSTPDSTLISALRILARDVESEDGVANAMLFEAAERFGKLVLEAHNLRAELERLRAERRWIPVEERLPEHDGDYLTAGQGRTSVCEFQAGYNFFGMPVTHWMPLPPLPDRREQDADRGEHGT